MKHLWHLFWLSVTLALISYASLRAAISADIPPLKNWGLFNTEAKSDIDAIDAWSIEEGSSKVVVAVIDTGIDPDHIDLRSNLWHDPRRPDVYGWDFVENKSNPVDTYGHGTHVAGIIGAISDPIHGVSGVVHRVSIMPVKFYSDKNPNSLNLQSSVSAINYAVDHGARIINYSGGGPEFYEQEYLALTGAEMKGILVVCAAGNEHSNEDSVEHYFYPAAYHLSNIISVAATDIHNNLLPSSNWGIRQVDVAAPGEFIFSTLPGNRYGYMSGTSQATAFVTGIAALLLSKNPKLTAAELKAAILKSVDPVPSLAGKISTAGHVDAYQALLAVQKLRH